MREMFNSISPKSIKAMTIIAVLIFSIAYVMVLYPNPIYIFFSMGILAIALIGNGLYNFIKDDLMNDDISVIIGDKMSNGSSVMNSISDGIVITDIKGRIRKINRGLCSFLDIEKELILGKNIYCFPGNRDKNFKNNLLAEIIVESLETQREIREFEMPYERHEELMYISVSTYLLRNKAKKLIGVIGIIHDLTQERRLEQNLIDAQKLVKAGQMAAELAHEIKNPICSIKGLIQLMGKKYSLDDNKYYEVINDELDRINVMLQRFLELTHSEPKLEKVCINSLIEEILPLLEGCAENKAIDININIQGKIPDIQADSENLRQVFVNIIQNGIEALPRKGKIDVSIWHERAKDMLRIEFKDNGSGVQPEIIDKIFEPFFTTKKNGSGLGLAISHKIIQNHKGRLTAHNNPDGGATFAIELPVQKAS